MADTLNTPDFKTEAEEAEQIEAVKLQTYAEMKKAEDEAKQELIKSMPLLAYAEKYLTTADDTPEARLATQNKFLLCDSILSWPFLNETSVPNLGMGSFSGVNVRDMEGNVEAARKIEEKKVEEKRLLPTLRYINYAGGSIELRFHQDGTKLVSAYKLAQDGTQVKEYASRLDFENILYAISERACALSTKFAPKEKVTEVKQLEDVSTLSDEG